MRWTKNIECKFEQKWYLVCRAIRLNATVAFYSCAGWRGCIWGITIILIAHACHSVWVSITGISIENFFAAPGKSKSTPANCSWFTIGTFTHRQLPVDYQSIVDQSATKQLEFRSSKKPCLWGRHFPGCASSRLELSFRKLEVAQSNLYILVLPDAGSFTV